jgi:hypothetical protein
LRPVQQRGSINPLNKKGDMTKKILLTAIKRRPEMNHEQFKQYWLTNHAKLEQENVAGATDLYKIVVSFLESTLDGKEPPWDAYVELYSDIPDGNSIDDKNNQRGRVMREDEEKFVDQTAEKFGYIVEEYIVAERPPKKAK